MKDFFELREGLVKVTDVEFDYRDQLPNSPKTSDIGAISSEWKQDRTALRDAVKKMGGLVTNTVAPSRGNKWVGTVTIGTRDDPKKLDDKSIQKAVKSHGIEIHSNQFRESTDLEEVKVKDFFELRESAISKRYGKNDSGDKFVVKYAKSKSGPMQTASFNLLAYAKKFLDDKKKEGYKGIISKGGKPVKEESLDELSAKLLNRAADKADAESDTAHHAKNRERAGKKYDQATRFHKGAKNARRRAIKRGEKVTEDLSESVELDEAKLSDMGIHNKIADRNLLIKAIKTAEKMGGNMTGAVREIEKMKKGLSKHKAVQAALQQANESVELDEAADFMKMSKELLKHKSKGIEYEKAAAYVRAIHNNSNVNVQDKAFMGLTKMLKDMEDFTKRTTITKILKDNGFKVKGGKLMREEVEPIVENYRTLAKHGMGAETKNSINVGRDVDYYQADGAKYMGKVTKITKTGYVVKDEKDGKSRSFSFYDRAKAKELLAK